jgi:DNA polymerase-1
MVTAEVFQVLERQLDSITSQVYSFSKALQGPVLDMRLRGILVDKVRRSEVIEAYEDKIDTLESALYRITTEAYGVYSFNWRSFQDLRSLFYGTLKIPPIRNMGVITTDRDALERLESYRVAAPAIVLIKALRDLGKRISFLKTEVDSDGRMRTSYNIAGTETGRFSSSLSEFGTGTNLQNVEDLLRSIFIADEGMKLAYFDAKQGESRCVGAIEWNQFRDGQYLEACEGGDLHTSVAKICWPELPWTGDLAVDTKLAEQPYYRHHSRRYMAKRLGHGTNYGGKVRTMSEQTKIPIDAVEDFQAAYEKAFPTHQKWREAVDRQLKTYGYLVSLTGRRRHFFGRRDAGETLREAIAFDPQGSLADIVNKGMLQVWKQNNCQLLLQNHDAIVIQFEQEREDEIIPLVIKQLEVPIQLKYGRTFTIPYGAKTGWNWGELTKDNPDGLKEFNPGDKRARTPPVPLLDRIFR